MPELPEVETVRRGLAELLPRRTAKDVQVFDSPKSFPNAPRDVEQFLYGAEVVAVRRRAKVLIIDLDTSYSLVAHLKMTGQLVFRGETHFGAGHPNDSLVGQLPDRSTRLQINFEDGARLFFNDQRKFGWVKLLPTSEVENLPFFKKVGPEPLEEETKPEHFIERIRRRNGSMVKPAILDQSVVAGIGNIYADEALWAAKIHPEIRVRDLADEQLETIFIEAVKVMALSIEKGGSTDRNYVDAEGKRGSYLEFAHVFRREGKACHVHPDQEIVKIRVAGRGTHICPVCQTAP
ncbi:DNA-formamidopyrimidine glycosylase [Candidatus Saccharibacteria bacterium 32-49-12]|nr:MAG: DNA-formamidopyrimidine glycosylase [Candidatus Saccharibacteria bacterium 32-49-12]